MRSEPRLRGRLALLAAAAVFLLVTGVGPAAAAARSDAVAQSKLLTLYSVPATAQFMNHADDRVRGMTNNPFNVNTKALVIITKGQEKGNGPFPGDDVLYTFKLYKDAGLQTSAGTAIFTCYYDFVKHAICDSYFELTAGTLVASGSVVFNSDTFTLSVGGGTNAYLGAHGQLAAVSTKSGQRLTVTLS